MTETLSVEVWADVSCPWCFIGKRRLARAVSTFTAQYPDVRVEIESHSFELTPAVPDGYTGSEVDFMVAYEGVPRDRAERTLEALTELGRSEGISFRFDRVRHVNTYSLHRLLHFAQTQGVQLELMDRLYTAYFVEGEYLGDTEVLVRLAGEVDLAEVSVRELLVDDDMLAGAVDLDMQRAHMLGVTAVPYFLLNRKYAIPGAVSESQFIEALIRVNDLTQAQTEGDTIH